MFLLFEELQAIFLSLIGGARYGIKIRLPHAVVMTLLFRRDVSAYKKLQSIVKLVAEHATNLAAFACIYKSTLAVLKWASRHRRDILHSSGKSNNNSDGFLRYCGQTLLSMIGTSNIPSNNLLDVKL